MAAWLALALMPVDARAQATGVRIPLDINPDGTMRTQITAGTASVATNGNITAGDVRIETYDRAGGIERMVEADDCFVDREAQMVTSTNNVRVTQKGLSIEGMGFEWHAEDQSFKLHSAVRVVFVRSPGMKLWEMP